MSAKNTQFLSSHKSKQPSCTVEYDMHKTYKFLEYEKYDHFPLCHLAKDIITPVS